MRDRLTNHRSSAGHSRPEVIRSRTVAIVDAAIAENFNMSAETVPTDVTSDLEAICAALAGRRPVDPIVAKRVRQRAEKVKEDIRRKGITDNAV